jgi:hypothetical protein
MNTVDSKHTPESFESVLSRFKNLESWLNDESHESSEFHIYLQELRIALQAMKDREFILSQALKVAREHIATQIGSIQYHHAPPEAGMIECAELAAKAVSESSVIQDIDEALKS